MANDDKTTETPENSRSGGGMVKKLVMFGVPLLMVQLVLAYFLLGKMFRPPQIDPLSTSQQQSEGKEDSGAELGQIYEVPDVIVNPRSSGVRRYLNVTFAFECLDKATVQELDKRNVQMRDLLIAILTSKSVDEIDEVEEKKQLKAEVVEKINQILTKGKVKAVYFSNFVIQ